MNFTPNSIKEERLLAFITFIDFVIKASWFSLLTFLVQMAQVVFIGTFHAISIRVIFMAELVLVNTGSVGSHDIVRVAFSTVAVVGNQTVRKLTHVESEVISSITFLTSSQEVFSTSVNFTAFSFRVESKWSPAGNTSAINVVAAEFFDLANAITVQIATFNALNAVIGDIVGLTVGISFMADSFV